MEANAHAILITKVNKSDAHSLRRHPVQQTDRVLGPISEAAVRMEVRARYLYHQIKVYEEILIPEIDYGKRERTEHTLDELMLELNIVLGWYLFQALRELKDLWNGPAIFKVRQEGAGNDVRFIAVVTQSDMTKYENRVARSPFKLGRASEFFHRIHLAPEDILPDEPSEKPS